MNKINKRDFLKLGLTGAGGLCILKNQKITAAMNIINEEKPWKWSREAMHYTQTPRGVKCLLCPNECSIREGNTGTCRNRLNYKDKLYSIAYGNPCAAHVDPIEKKPLMHFMPGTYAYSIATAGCNFACLNCQNWDISQSSPKETSNMDLMPSRVVEEALKNNCQSIAYTYAEPIAFYEYVYDTAKLAREKKIKNVLVSNGYINEKPLRELCKYLDAANINLKSFSDDIYLRLNAGKLQPVLNTLKIMKEENIWLEITNLVVPSWTDDFDMIKKMCDWIVANGLENYPLHFLRFHPMYKLTQLPSTPVNTLQKAKEIAIKAGCKYVYVGNVTDPKALNTYCPKCKGLVLERSGYTIVKNNIQNGKCKSCGEKISGVWS
jgi:pyruvate formate lyase activating enzyme